MSIRKQRDCQADFFTLSVLTHRTKTLTATYTPDSSGKVTKQKAPSNTAFFQHREEKCRDIDSLEALLRRLSTQPKSCIVRAQRIEGVGVESNSVLPDGSVRRAWKGKPKPYTKTIKQEGKDDIVIEVDAFEPALAPADRVWVCADADGIFPPFDVTVEDDAGLDEAARWLLKDLGLDGVDAIVHWSSGAFLNEDATVSPRKLKAHVWFYLDRPACFRALSGWMTARKLDPSLSRAVQIHYTADPVFNGALKDPLAWRIKTFRGEQRCFITDPQEIYDTAEEKRREEEAKRQAEEEAAKQKQHREEQRRIAEERGLAVVHYEAVGADKSLAVQRIVDAALDEVRFASSRHGAIYGQAFWLGRVVGGDNGLRYSEAQDALESLLPSLFAGEPGREEDEKRTIKDGLDAGCRLPHEVTPPQARTREKKKRGEKRSAEEKAPVSAEEKEERANQKVSLIERFVRYSEQAQKRQCDARYLPPLAKEEALTAVCASLGTGKTEQAKALCEQYNSTLWLAHRRALTRNTVERLGEDWTLYMDAEDHEIEADRLVVCVDSVARAKRLTDSIMIDEADQVLQSLVKRPSKAKRGEQHGDSILANIEHLRFRLEHAKQAALLSADLDEHTIKAFSRLAPHLPVKRVNHHYTPEGQAWRFYDSYTALREFMRARWVEDERFAVFCASREQAKNLAAWLRHFQGKRVLEIHAESDDDARETLSAVNATWTAYDAVLFTTSAGAGVSFDVKDHFDHVFVVGVNAPNNFMATEYLQGAARIRYPKNPLVHAFIPPQARRKLSRQEIASLERDKEEQTLLYLEAHAPLAVRLHRIERSSLDSLAVQVWLDAAEQREERSHAPLHYLLKTLLARGIDIQMSSGEPPQSETKRTAKECSKARQERIATEYSDILAAPDLTPQEAKALGGKEVKREDQVALKRHRIAAFYNDTRSEDAESTASSLHSSPPPAPTLDQIQRDNNGKLPRKIRNLIEAMLWRSSPQYAAYRDSLDLVGDPTQPARRVRSVLDASNYAAKGQLLSDYFAVVEAMHPDIYTAILDAADEKDKPLWSRALRRTQTPLTVEAALQRLLLRTKQRRVQCAVRGIRPDAPLNEIVGNICAAFGIKRRRIENLDAHGKKYSHYILDRDEILALVRLTRCALVRTMRSVGKWEEQASLAAEGRLVFVPISEDGESLLLGVGGDAPPFAASPREAVVARRAAERMDEAARFNLLADIEYGGRTITREEVAILLLIAPPDWLASHGAHVLACATSGKPLARQEGRYLREKQARLREKTRLDLSALERAVAVEYADSAPPQPQKRSAPPAPQQTSDERFTAEYAALKLRYGM